MELRAFPGKVDTGFPIGNATNIESRALSGHDPCNFRVNLIGKRSRLRELTDCNEGDLTQRKYVLWRCR